MLVLPNLFKPLGLQLLSQDHCVVRVSMLPTTDTNYLASAKEDDDYAIRYVFPSADTPRAARIVKAVERSRLEYLPEHAYIEREWFMHSSTRSPVKPKIDRQRLEFLVTLLYCRGEHSRALATVSENFHTAGCSQTMSRELLDAGIRSAIKSGDSLNAVTLARLGKSTWTSLQPGMAATAADAFNFADMPFDAISPLLASISTSGLQAPILERCLLTIDRVEEPTQVLRDFRDLVANALGHRQQLGRPLFSSPLSSDNANSLDSREGALRQIDDVAALSLALRLGDDINLRSALHKLSRGVKEDDLRDRSVREL